MLNETGWTTLHSSDGTSFSNNSDVIGTSVAALAHANAYFDLNSPDNKRTFIFQRGGTSRLWAFRTDRAALAATGPAVALAEPTAGLEALRRAVTLLAALHLILLVRVVPSEDHHRRWFRSGGRRYRRLRRRAFLWPFAGIAQCLRPLAHR